MSTRTVTVAYGNEEYRAMSVGHREMIKKRTVEL